MPTAAASADDFIHKRPLYAIGKTQAYLLSLVAPSRPIVLLKSYDQLVDEKLFSYDVSTTRQGNDVHPTTTTHLRTALNGWPAQQ